MTTGSVHIFLNIREQKIDTKVFIDDVSALEDWIGTREWGEK